MHGVEVLRCPYLGIYVNSFAVRAGDLTVLIDSGLQNGRAALKRFCNGDTALLCTHGHWDHIGNHRYLQAGGATVYAHAADGRYLSDYAWHWRVLFEQFANDFALPATRRTTFFSEVGEPLRPDECLYDNCLLTLGGQSIQVLSTPGHSDGSVCFLFWQEGLLFTGDSLMGNGFFGGIPQYTNPVSYKTSMERLMRIDAETVCCDHNEPMDGRLLCQKAEQSILCAERIGKRVTAFVQAYRGTAETLLGDAAKDVCQAEGKNVGGGACVTVLAHLRTLSEEYPVAKACVNRHLAP